MSELGFFHHPTLAHTQAALTRQFSALTSPAEQRLVSVLQQSLERYDSAHHGDFTRWRTAIGNLPDLHAREVDFSDRITLRGPSDAISTQQLKRALLELQPWRKGPFELFGLAIDTEWRSDWKWRRLATALGDLTNQRVLDVGCGNGYFGWRLLQAGARNVLGIDPTLLFCMQHLAINRYLKDDRNWVLPLRLEDLPTSAAQPLGFDGALSMGVIYHRRDPLDHLHRLFQCLQPGGWLVLESLVVDAPEPIYPGTEGSRYARMRNVWCVPTIALLSQWLLDCGFAGPQLLADSETGTEEQHSTAWMTFESLPEALDPAEPTRTVEGWPRPRRAVLLTHRP